MTPERERLVRAVEDAWRKFAFASNMSNQYLYAWQDEHRAAERALAAYDAAHNGGRMSEQTSHRIGWQDQGMVSYYCGKNKMGYLSKDDGIIACPGCGKRIKLRWDVRIEEAK